MCTKEVTKAVFLFLLALGLLVFASAGSGQAQPQDRPEYVPDEILVKFKDGVAKDVVDTIVAQVAGEVIKKFRLISVWHLKVPADTAQRAVNFLKNLPEVEYAEPNYLRYLNATPNDPQYPEMWGLNNTGQTGGTIDADIDAPEAWNSATGSSAMVAADIDTGIDKSHEDLSANLYTNPGEIAGNGIDDDFNGYVDDVNGWDFARDDNNPNEEAICGGHGTHTAGTIGARGNNGIGVTGVNWNVKIMPLKIFKAYLVILCSASSADIISAIDYAAMMGVRVSNNSYGGGPFSQAEYDAIRASRSIFVAAAGNDGTNNDLTPSYPASYNLNNIISVAATDHNDARASFSNYGTTSVDLAAPGVSILSTTPNNTYSLFDGTSMATPHVTGAVALLMGHDPAMTNYEIKWRILKGTDPKGLSVLTKGRLNAFKALTLTPQIDIAVTPLGSTTIHPGDSVPYQVTLINLSASSKTVTRKIYARHPDGAEGDLVAETTVTLSAGETLTEAFTVTVPPTLPPAHFGQHYLVGRVSTSGFQDFAEDEVVYSLTP